MLGAPGTGKTTTVVEAVVDRVQATASTPSEVPGARLDARVAAARAARAGHRAARRHRPTEPLARTHQAFGVRRPAPGGGRCAASPAPRLLSGPEQDVILRELLAGHAAGRGRRRRPGPSTCARRWRTRGFRSRAARPADAGRRARASSPTDLAALGARARPARVGRRRRRCSREYDEVTAFSPARAPTTRPGSSARRPTCSTTTPTRSTGCARGAAPRRRRRRPGADLGGGPAAAAWSGAPASTCVLVGDPDAAVQTFRGADPRLLGDPRGPALGERRRRPGRCRVAHRQPDAAAAVSRAGRPGGSGRLGGGRSPRAGRAAGRRRPGRRRAAARDRPRRRRSSRPSCAGRTCSTGCRGRRWRSSCAGRGATGALRRVLMSAGVPVAVSANELPRARRAGGRPAAVAARRRAAGRARRRAAPIDPETAVDALLSPLGGADTVGAPPAAPGPAPRGARRRWRPHQRRAAGRGARCTPTSTPTVGPEAAPARRVARALAAGVEAARTVRDEGRTARCAGRPG